jgi:hypothetical protein
MNRFVLFTIAVLSFLPAHARAQEVSSIPNIAQFEAEQACLKKAEKVLERGWDVLRQRYGLSRWKEFSLNNDPVLTRELDTLAKVYAGRILERAKNELFNCLEEMRTK